MFNVNNLYKLYIICATIAVALICNIGSTFWAMCMAFDTILSLVVTLHNPLQRYCYYLMCVVLVRLLDIYFWFSVDWLNFAGLLLCCPLLVDKVRNRMIDKWLTVTFANTICSLLNRWFLHTLGFSPQLSGFEAIDLYTRVCNFKPTFTNVVAVIWQLREYKQQFHPTYYKAKIMRRELSLGVIWYILHNQKTQFKTSVIAVTLYQVVGLDLLIDSRVIALAIYFASLLPDKIINFDFKFNILSFKFISVIITLIATLINKYFIPCVPVVVYLLEHGAHKWIYNEMQRLYIQHSWRILASGNDYIDIVRCILFCYLANEYSIFGAILRHEILFYQAGVLSNYNIMHLTYISILCVTVKTLMKNFNKPKKRLVSRFTIINDYAAAAGVTTPTATTHTVTPTVIPTDPEISDFVVC